MMQPVESVDRKPVANRHADRIGDKRRHPAGTLGDEMSRGADEADGKVIIFVDVRTECRPFDVGVDLIGDGDEPMPNNFHRNGVD